MLSLKHREKEKMMKNQDNNNHVGESPKAILPAHKEKNQKHNSAYDHEGYELNAILRDLNHYAQQIETVNPSLSWAINVALSLIEINLENAKGGVRDDA
jgi:hypothetical protein